MKTILDASKHDEQMDYIDWKHLYLRLQPKDNTKAYVWYNQQGYSGSKDYITVSEAQGYGMLLAVYNNDQSTFDALNRYYLSRLNSKGLMKWRTQVSPADSSEIIESPENNTCATDGDMDIVYSLLLAYERWGDLDYKSHAMNGLNSLYNHCMNKEHYVPLLGDWVSSNGPKNWSIITRPSDFLLLHFEKFSEYHVVDPTFWLQVATTCKGILHQFSKQTRCGLVPDFIVYNSRKRRWERPSDQVLETPHDRDYFYNSCRVPWRLAEYYNSTQDNLVREVLEKYVKFFKRTTQDTDYVNVGYTLEGRKLNKEYYDLAFTGPVQLMFQVLGEPKKFRIDYDNYFGDTVYLTGKYGIEYIKTTDTTNYYDYNEMIRLKDDYTIDLSGVISNSFDVNVTETILHTNTNRRRRNRGGTMYIKKEITFDDDKYEKTIKTALTFQYGIVEIQGTGDFDCYLWRVLKDNEPEYLSNLPIKFKGADNANKEENVYTLDWHMYQIRFFVNKKLVFTWANNCYYDPMHLVVTGDNAKITRMNVWEYKRSE